MISLNSIHINSSGSIIRLLSRITLSLVVMAAAASCSDDDSPFSGKSNSGGSDLITFSVSTSDTDWNTTTRAADNSDYPSSGYDTYTSSRHITLLSTQSEKPLYLIPETHDGIDLSARAGKTTSPTRSSLTDNDNIVDFGVFASLRPDGSSSTTYSPDYMYNVQVTKANSWAPANEYLWPNKASLHINAYSPFTSQASTATEGITSLPASDAAGDLSLSWATPADVADQFDLLWATPQDASASPCDLTFNHALTAIKFITGSEMAPCTVKEIKISGIADGGSLNLETGAWTLSGSKTDYTLSPDLVLTAAEGSSFAAPSTAITSDDETLLLLPQSLSAENEITLTIDFSGTEYSFTASLDGQTWTAGKTVVYRLSANPVTNSLILSILDSDGNAVSTLKSSYTGGDLNYTVKSYSSEEGTVTQIPWKAEFIDDNGNVIDRPEWISSFILSGDGDTECVAPTEMQTPTFSTISAETSSLRSASDINATSGNTPYNLSNSNGGTPVENTANTYIISAPGQYSLPLVYGNAVKNGAANTSAYSWSTHTKNVLTTFLNHLGNGITDPYIYNNTGCEPYDAYLVWEGRIGTIENLSLSSDKHSLLFDVSPDFIRQGNALVAVRDKDGNIMWSWQIWFTSHAPEDGMMTFSYNNQDYHIMARNIGQTTGGDTADFAAQSVKVRFTQVTDGSVDPKSAVITIERDAYTETTSFHYSYYQWGRKDPFNSGVNVWYNSNKAIISSTPTTPYASRPTDLPFVSSCILHPATFWTASHDDTTEPSYEYLNLWNAHNTNTNCIKSVYDPSPVGFRVPNIEMTVFNTESGSTYPVALVSRYTDYASLEYTLPGGSLDFTLFGYLSSNDAQETNSESIGPVWLNSSQNTRDLKEARYLPFSANLSFANATMSRSMGYGVRPIKDE